MLHLIQMRISFLSIFFLLLYLFSTLVYAQSSGQQNTVASPQLQTITLKDGTVLKGQLVKIVNDIYVIQTPSVGEVQVKVTDLASISNGGISPAQNLSATAGNSLATTNAAERQGQVAQLQQQLLGDPELQSSIQALMKDPAIMDLLTNGNLIQDALSMDPEKAKSNQNIQKLMENPKMQDLMQKINQKINGANASSTSELLK